MSSSKATLLAAAEPSGTGRLSDLKQKLTTMMRSVPPCMTAGKPMHDTNQEYLEIHHDGNVGNEMNSRDSKDLATYPLQITKVTNKDCQMVTKNSRERDRLHPPSSAITFKYRDFSYATERELDFFFPGQNESSHYDKWGHNGQIPMKNRKFPSTLYGVLADPSQEFQQIISWMPHGRSFKILDKTKFGVLLLASYFQCANLRGFFKKLRGWGFQRIDSGQDNGAYFSELFLRGKPQLLKYMRRTQAKDCVENAGDPNFYLMLQQRFLKPLPAPGVELSHDLGRPTDGTASSPSIPRMGGIAHQPETTSATTAARTSVRCTGRQSFCSPLSGLPNVRDHVTNETEIFAATMHMPRLPQRLIGGDRMVSSLSTPMTMEQAIVTTGRVAAPSVCNPFQILQIMDEYVDACSDRRLKDIARPRQVDHPTRHVQYQKILSPHTLQRASEIMDLETLVNSGIQRCPSLADTTDDAMTSMRLSMQRELNAMGSIQTFASTPRLVPSAGTIHIPGEILKQDNVIDHIDANRMERLEAELEREMRRMPANRCTMGDPGRLTSFRMRDQSLSGVAPTPGMSRFMGCTDPMVKSVLKGPSPLVKNVWSSTMRDMSFKEMEKVDVDYMRYCMGDRFFLPRWRFPLYK